MSPLLMRKPGKIGRQCLSTISQKTGKHQDNCKFVIILMKWSHVTSVSPVLLTTITVGLFNVLLSVYTQSDKAWRCVRRLKRDISSQFNLATEKQQINNREFDNLLQAKSQLLCLPLLCLRVPQPRQRPLPDLLHGLLPWRRVHNIRQRGKLHLLSNRCFICEDI